MKIRDMHSTLSGDKTEYTMPSGGLQIIADDGRTMFTVRLAKEGHIEVSGGSFCKHGGKILDDLLIVEPRACNLVYVRRMEYAERKPGKP